METKNLNLKRDEFLASFNGLRWTKDNITIAKDRRIRPSKLVPWTWCYFSLETDYIIWYSWKRSLMRGIEKYRKHVVKVKNYHIIKTVLWSAFKIKIWNL